MAGAEFSPLAERIGALVGADRVRAPIAAEAACAETIVEPATVEEVSTLVRLCEADRIALAALGACRTLSQIRRAPVALGVSLKRLSRIVAYEPDDMTVVAEAGITLGELNAAMAASRQRLPVDPSGPALTTLGSLIAAAHAGSLRLSEGTARDLLIGVRFVGHGGAIVHGGGRVVKNVAGYDLMKVIGGAFGTLGIVVEAAFKVRPIPAEYRLAIVPFANAAEAFATARALNDHLPLSHLEVLSSALVDRRNENGRFILMAGFSGGPEEIGYQADQIHQLVSDSVEILSDDAAARAYERLRDFDPHGASLCARIALPPARLAPTLEACGAAFRAHAGSGVAQLVIQAKLGANEARARVARWRAIAHSQGGHLTIVAAAAAIRGALDFFDTPNDGALALMRRLKAAFDPAGIFNPGCFVGGI